MHGPPQSAELIRMSRNLTPMDGAWQVVDKESNLNGGMLVIATSIPDEREWIQWKGRTARQVGDVAARYRRDRA